MINPLAAFRYVRGVSRAVRRGDTFPHAGRVAAADAPGGSRRSLAVDARKELDRIEISEHIVPVVGLLRPIEVLHLTDVHIRTHDDWVRRVADVVRQERPDLVAITGDVVTRGWQQDAVDCFLGAIPAAPLGRWAVMGNWEYWGGAPRETWEPILNTHGIELLHDRVVHADGMDVMGTDDLLAGDPDLEAVFAAASGQPALLLTHSPGIFPRLAKAPVRVVLAGHTHGGQIRIPGLGPFFLPRGSGIYPWGWYEMDGVSMFVSRGLGWSVAPMRWRCLPEIARIKLVPA